MATKNKKAGRPNKFGTEAALLTIRVPKIHKAAIAKKIAEILKPYVK